MKMKSFIYQGSMLLNGLPNCRKTVNNVGGFKTSPRGSTLTGICARATRGTRLYSYTKDVIY